MRQHSHKNHEPGPDTGGDAEALDHLIDEVVAGSPVGELGDDRNVVSALSRVREMAAEPIPTSSRARHLTTIRTAHATSSTPRRTFFRPGVRFQRRLAPITAAVAALFVFAGGGTVALAQDADPDDALYPVKQGSEQFWLALPRGSERVADVHLALAERRLAEAGRAPHHAEDLVAAAATNVEAASGEKPEEALASFARLLGTSEDALPEEASPAARTALYRNCVRIAEKHGLAHTCPEPADLGEHPGRGRGLEEHPGGGQGIGPAATPRGWGPGGRPEGQVGPPPGVPAHERGNPGEEAD